MFQKYILCVCCWWNVCVILTSLLFDKKERKIKASAGIEPATFRLLGERTAIYAKRPYIIHCNCSLTIQTISIRCKENQSNILTFEQPSKQNYQRKRKKIKQNKIK